MIQNSILFSVIILFFLNACGQLYYAFKLNKKFESEHSLGNSILTGVLWMIAGILYPFYFPFNSSGILFFKILSVFFICIFTPILIGVILLYQYLFVVKKDPQIKKKKNIKIFLENFERNPKLNNNNYKIHSLKVDFYRKALHLFPAGVIIILWIFSVYIWDGMWNADEFWKINGEQFGRFLIITAGYSGILIFAALDYLRLSYIFEKKNLFHLIPSSILSILSKSLKKREIFEFTKPVALVLAFTPIFFLPFGIFSAAALISTIGDGAASLCGLKYGKKKFLQNSNKTIVGYIAGFLASFFISLLSLLIFMPTLDILKTFLMPLVGAMAFVLIDLSNLSIDDNILNPLIAGGFMALIYYLI
jgi:dolichol kinase